MAVLKRIIDTDQTLENLLFQNEMSTTFRDLKLLKRVKNRDFVI
jgi:hypothetical protein